MQVSSISPRSLEGLVHVGLSLNYTLLSGTKEDLGTAHARTYTHHILT
jgi:hypothetical protein